MDWNGIGVGVSLLALALGMLAAGGLLGALLAWLLPGLFGPVRMW